MKQVKSSAGNLRAASLRDARLTFWTVTVWESEAAMRSFMLSGAHRRAMPKLLHWCDEASVAHWNQETAELPDWLYAHKRMVADGRLSKVNNPSPDQQAKWISPPRLSSR